MAAEDKVTYTEEIESFDDAAERMARLEEHKKRVGKELKRLGLDPEDDTPSTRSEAPKTRKKEFPQSRDWEDIKLVNCALCYVELLGESEEPYRIVCMRVNARKYARMLPPPVQRRIYGRPFCAVCCPRIATSESAQANRRRA